jgi:hypothetical protein
MFYDVVTKFKDEPPRVTWTFGSDTSVIVNNDTLKDLLTIIDNKDCEYVKIELSTYWRSKRDEQGNSN